MDHNICRFIPAPRNNDRIAIINFVLETKPQTYNNLNSCSVYRIHLVAKGNATLHLPGRSIQIQQGDLFFCLPGFPYAIESDAGFEYMYISFLGIRTNAILDSLHIHRQHCVFHGFAQLLPLWRSSLTISQNVADLCAEGILLYSFSVLGNDLLQSATATAKSSETVQKIQQYVDEHFSNPDLSLETIGTACSYHPKYLSSLFKKHLGIGVSEYINTIRIRHAYLLMEQGFTSVKTIALLCGYKDPMYFSKVFKGHLGCAPRSYIANTFHK